jgi:hypothetical protein
MDVEAACKILCVLLLCFYGVFFIYYVYVLRNIKALCQSEKEEELPCPNTCNPGYECTQTEGPTEFVIGDVVEEKIFDELQQSPEDTGATPTDTEDTIRLDV